MKAGKSGSRGWPLVSLGLVLGGWVLLRAALWEAPFPPVIAAIAEEVQGSPSSAGETAVNGQPGPALVSDASSALQLMPHDHDPLARPGFDSLSARGGSADGPAGSGGTERIATPAAQLIGASGGDKQRERQTALRSGVTPIAPGVTNAPEATSELAQGPGTRRWSGDFWALWREDTTTALTSGRPSYGRSQAGAILRYHLDPPSDLAPRLYLRATRALEGERETDLAMGASARPIPAVPVRLAAEARVSETDRDTEMRGAVYAVTELPPVALPAGLTAEAYVQGGYVTGEFATPFVDGQARVTRELAGTQDLRLMAGAAAWGGAQDDAQRLDIGPSVGVGFRIGRARGRVAADYRIRIAGDAEPSSGPALTLMAGF